MRTKQDSAWLYALPAVLLLSCFGLVPLLAVLNYSFFDIFTLQDRYWVGLEWYGELIRSAEFYATLGRSLLFTTLVVAIQFPLGVGISLIIPKNNFGRGIILMILAIPLVVPWNMIPIIWLNLVDPEFGWLSAFFDAVEWDFDYKFNAIHTWLMLLTIDTWHWVGLVAILSYSGLSSIPGSFYQAAHIDGASRWAVFRYIQIPKIRTVLMMALLLRVMDSLMIYTEVFFVNAGGPNAATSFLSLELGEEISAFNYGPAAARSVVYFLLVLLLAWGFKLATHRMEGDHR